MKKEYDFSKAVKGKFYRPASEIEIPIYLNGKAKDILGKIALEKHLNLSDVVNKILNSEIDIFNSYFSIKR